MRARAASNIQHGRLDVAAIYYAQSGLSFDEVALCLLHCLDAHSSTASSIAPDLLTPVTTATASVAGSTGTSGSAMSESNAAYFTSSSSAASAPSSSSSSSLPGLHRSDSSRRFNNSNSAGNVYTRLLNNKGTATSLIDTAISVGAALTPLRVFLLQVLRSQPSSAKMQRTMLCTWLCDLYLHQISLAKLLNPAEASPITPKTGAGSNNPNALGATVMYESTVKSDDALDEAELTVQFKNFLRSNK